MKTIPHFPSAPNAWQPRRPPTSTPPQTPSHPSKTLCRRAAALAMGATKQRALAPPGFWTLWSRRLRAGLLHDKVTGGAGCVSAAMHLIIWYAGTDERWGKGHRHSDGVCDRQLKHGDWRGQKVWQVPAETLKHHFDDIVVMLNAAAKICSQEPAVMQLQQPCHVFGDIHGNFSDLKYFESLLWPLGISFTAGTFLWLGDYVDRGALPSSCNCRSVSILISRVQALLPWRPSCITQPPTTTHHAPADRRPQTAFVTRHPLGTCLPSKYCIPSSGCCSGATTRRET
jgi:hypothetical protein